MKHATGSLRKPRPKLRDPRPPQFRTVDETTDEDNCIHDLQLALALLAEDEGRDIVDTLIRDACHAAAGSSDLFRARQLAAIPGAKLGDKMACEILAAIGWLMSG